MFRWRKPVVMAGILAFLFGGSLFFGAKRMPGQVKLDQILVGADADKFVADWAAQRPSFREQLEASTAFWGEPPLPGRSKVVKVKIVQEPSPWRKILAHVIPNLRADRFDDPNGNGYVITTAVSSPPEQWNGHWYMYHNTWQGDLGADAIIDASQDLIGDPNWVGHDRGSVSERHPPIQPIGAALRCGKPDWLARTVQAIWPRLDAVCECPTLCRGFLSNCALRNALGRARATCGLAAAACKRAGPGYLACLADICAGAVYVYWFDEIYQYGDYCGWLDPCNGPPPPK